MVGVAQGILYGDFGELGGVEAPEGAARSGDKQPPHTLRSFPGEALGYGRVFRVHGIHFRAGMAQRVCDEFAGDNQGLLVGQGYLFVGFYGTQCGGEPAVAYRGCHYGVETVGLHGVVDGVLACGCLYAERFQSVFQFPVQILVGYNGHPGTPFLSLEYECVNFVSGHKKGRLESVGIFLYYFQCLGADRSGAPEHCYTFASVFSCCLHIFHSAGPCVTMAPVAGSKMTNIGALRSVNAFGARP